MSYLSRPRLLLAVAITIAMGGCDEPTGPRSEVRYVDVSAGRAHTCAITETGSTYCWGSNTVGQLGTGDTAAASTTPRQVAGSLRLERVEAGGDRSCGVDAEGAVYCWSSYQDGVRRTTPVRRPAEVRFLALSTHERAGHALSEDGRLYDDLYLHTDLAGFQAVTAAESLTFAGITSGVYRVEGGSCCGPSFPSHVCAWTPEGTAYCWGDNAYGQLGTGDGTIRRVPSPQPVMTALRFRQLDSGSDVVCGVTLDGALYCWGAHLGARPVQLMPARLFESVSVGTLQGCAIAVGGEGLCWEISNPVGARALPRSLRFRRISVGTSADRLFAAAAHACGITTQGALYCWGSNVNGQLGDGSHASSDQPVKVSEPHS